MPLWQGKKQVANPWKILTTVTASSDALFQSNVTVNGNTNLGNASSDIVTLAGQVTASADVLLQQKLTVNGDVNLGDTSADVVTITGQATASNGLYVNGGLKVDGTLTYVNTTNLNVTDRKVTFANGATDVDGQGPAGLYIGSDTSPLASVYAQGTTAAWHVSGAGGLFVAATSSADMTNIGSGIVSAGEFNVENTFRAIDSKLATATTISTIRTEYDKLRFVQTGSLSTGNAVVSLAKNAFVNANKNFITLDVMVRDSNSNPWTNDLVSVYMANGATYAEVTIDAPGIAGGSWEYKLVAVNENTGSLGIIA